MKELEEMPSAEEQRHLPGIALLSFAHGHQAGWANILRSDRRVRLVCAWDEDSARGRAAAEKLAIPFLPRLDEALTYDGVTAVTICSTNDAHADLAVAAARAGKDIMLQKPMATTLADCDSIVAAVEEAGVRFYQSHNLRFDPVHQEVKRLVAAGELGKIAIARRRHSHPFALTDRALLDNMALTDAMKAGGGAFMDEGAHVALWFLWMFGAPVSVMGMVAASLTTQQPAVEDNGVLLYRYADGMIGLHQSSWTELASTSTIELSGERGVLVATGTDITASRSATPGEPPLRLWRHETKPAPGAWWTPEVQLASNRMAGTAQAFADMLASGAASPCDARTARTAVAMVLAGYASSRDGREVPVER
ncbi:MAG TPA: Gfo/Idh/MocA family oxidoreductase [Chloroflexota bacterium]|nr:Gfo/Idh/MocA family oxidoreductase [Chloroflexota bacterium]